MPRPYVHRPRTPMSKTPHRRTASSPTSTFAIIPHPRHLSTTPRHAKPTDLQAHQLSTPYPSVWTTPSISPPTRLKSAQPTRIYRNHPISPLSNTGLNHSHLSNRVCVYMLPHQHLANRPRPFQCHQMITVRS